SHDHRRRRGSSRLRTRRRYAGSGRSGRSPRRASAICTAWASASRAAWSSPRRRSKAAAAASSSSPPAYSSASRARASRGGSPAGGAPFASRMFFLPQQPQAFEPLVHARQGGVQRAAQRGGDLAEAFALVDALADHLALRQRQALQQLAQAAGLVV